MNTFLKNDLIVNKTCITITEKNPQKIYERLNHALNVSKYAEIRLDYLDNEKYIKKTINSIGKKINRCICTLRDVSEGGRFDGNEKERTYLFECMYNANPFLIDIEFNIINKNNKIFKLLKLQKNLLVSWHKLDNTPTYYYLTHKLSQMKKISTNVKIITTANSISDNIRILSLYKNSNDISLIAFAMGHIGKISRLICLYLGSPFSYVVINKNVAEGQFKLSEHNLFFKNINIKYT
ncbi:MAG: type I 3-dehydroquinate dehydratase [Thaumarchaeota archaeon]|nr:type I 3-dehydroquinate dehydratase [Nitrososphaerota archaeon]